MKQSTLALGLACVCFSGAVLAQTPESEYHRFQSVEALANHPAVSIAMAAAREIDARSEAFLVELTEIPAPPFEEQARAIRFAELLGAAGLSDVVIDDVGNVLGRRPGTGGGPTVALVAHLDTVFPEGTDVTVSHRGERLYAPGIGDDTRGLVLLLTMVQALDEVGLDTLGDLLFVGSVGEEGLGDLRGVRHLFREDGPTIDAFIAIDGGSDSRVVNQALGSRRYLVTITGPGGHSWGDFGLGNPALALSRAMYLFDDAAATVVNTGPVASYSVGRLGGGTSVNAIPHESWAEVDLRSVDRGQLDRLDEVLAFAVERALDEQNRRRDRGDALEAGLEAIGERPSGMVASDHPLVVAAMEATRHLGFVPRLGAASTDANIPISLGIPAITLGRGGRGGGVHSLEEWWSGEGAYLAVQRALLVTLAAAGLVAP